MSLNVNGSALAPGRYTPQTAPAVTQLTQRDVAAAARVGLQAVPVRNNDPVTGSAKKERHGDTLKEKQAAADRDRLDMLRFAALRRDVAAITGNQPSG